MPTHETIVRNTLLDLAALGYWLLLLGILAGIVYLLIDDYRDWKMMKKYEKDLQPVEKANPWTIDSL